MDIPFLSILYLLTLLPFTSLSPSLPPFLAVLSQINGTGSSIFLYFSVVLFPSHLYHYILYCIVRPYITIILPYLRLSSLNELTQQKTLTVRSTRSDLFRFPLLSLVNTAFLPSLQHDPFTSRVYIDPCPSIPKCHPAPQLSCRISSRLSHGQ